MWRGVTGTDGRGDGIKRGVVRRGAREADRDLMPQYISPSSPRPSSPAPKGEQAEKYDIAAVAVGAQTAPKSPDFFVVFSEYDNFDKYLKISTTYQKMNDFDRH